MKSTNMTFSKSKKEGQDNVVYNSKPKMILVFQSLFVSQFISISSFYLKYLISLL